MHVLGMACLKPDPVIGGQCNSRLGGMIGPNGKWKSKRWDLFKAMGRLGLSNSTTLRRRIETYKAEYQAEKVAAAAKESLGEAPQEGGSQQDFQGGTSRPE